MCGSIYFGVFNLQKMKEIKLSQGKIALVDDEDFERASNFNWHWYANGRTFYCIRNIKLLNKRSTQSLHRFILNLSTKNICNLEVDHIDGNGLNNQKSNLRICTHSDNMKNKRSSKNSTSKYNGVHWNKRDKVYTSEIRNIYIGNFKNEIDAAKAYDEYAKLHNKEFARLNFPD